MLHKWIIPIVLFIGFIVAFPLTALSQKTLRLDLKKRIEDIPLNALVTRAGGKLVRTIECYNSEGVKKMTMNLEYDEKGRIIKTQNQGDFRMLQENRVSYYKLNDQTLTMTSKDINTGELMDKVICELNDQGYIVKEEVLLEDGDAYDEVDLTYYEYDGNNQTLSLKGILGNYEFVQTYDWENGNVMNGYPNGPNSNQEHYIYTDIENKMNIELVHLFAQVYNEDIFQFAVLGYIGKKNSNLIEEMGDYAYEYTFDSDGYVSVMTECYKGKELATVVVSYDGIIDPSPDPTPDNNPTTEDELGGAIDNAPEGTEDSPTEIFIPSGGITLHKPLNVYKHIRLKGGSLIRGNDNPYAMLRIHSGYSLELDDITIDGNGVSLKDGSLIVYGKLKLKDGVTIKNCKRIETDTPSGAVCIAKGGELTMDGGTITGNIGAYGSAVYNEGIFTMTDGEISSNTGQIGAVANNGGGQFIMTGGKISSNKVTDGCGGVFVSELCFFRMTGGEISGNEDCALYTWANLQIGGQAKVDGLTLMNDGNRLLINPSLRNNWQISYVETPPVGTIVAVGYNGYQLADSDLQKVIYYNNVSQLKLAGNSIVTYQTETNVNKINTDKFRLSVFGNQVKVEGLLAYTRFIIYEIRGRAVVSHITDGNGQYCFSLENGIYLLTCKDQKRKFLVK